MLNLIKLPQVFTINQVPKVFHEDGIISGYRHPCSSAKDCVLSLFQLTNETLLVSLPTWFFLWKLLTVVLVKDDWQDPFIWPFLVFLLSCCVYPLASSCAHTFMSERARQICFFFDYGALSFYSLAVVNSVISTALACYSRCSGKLNHKLSKCLRITAFVYPYLFDNIPLFYRIFVFNGEGCTVNEASTVHYQHSSLAVLTGFLFATHLPERLAPGSFDNMGTITDPCILFKLRIRNSVCLILVGCFQTSVNSINSKLWFFNASFTGHSHQLFHVFAIIGTYFQMTAIELDMATRKQWLHAHLPPVTLSNTGSCIL